MGENEEFTTADLIDELQAYVGGGEREPGGVTACEWAKAEGVSENNAGTTLGKLFKAGKLTRRKYRVEGRAVFVYYKATPEALASQ